MNYALHAHPDHWLDILRAHLAGRPWTFALGGKSDDPPRFGAEGLVYVVAWGKLRFRAPLTPRRFEKPGPGYQRQGQERVFPECPAGGLLLGPEGYRVEVDLARLEPVTVAMPYKWHLGAREAPWREPPKAAGMLADDMERAFPGWAFEGLPVELQGPARALVPLPAPVVAAVQVKAPAKRRAAPKVAEKPAAAPGAVVAGQSFDLFHRGGV